MIWLIKLILLLENLSMNQNKTLILILISQSKDWLFLLKKFGYIKNSSIFA